MRLFWWIIQILLLLLILVGILESYMILIMGILTGTYLLKLFLLFNSLRNYFRGFFFSLFFTLFCLSNVKADYVYCLDNALSCPYSSAVQHAFPAKKPLNYSITETGIMIPSSLTYKNSDWFYVLIYMAVYLFIVLSIFTLYL